MTCAVVEPSAKVEDGATVVVPGCKLDEVVIVVIDGVGVDVSVGLTKVLV
jgi:hypothetical protein